MGILQGRHRGSTTWAPLRCASPITAKKRFATTSSALCQTKLGSSSVVRVLLALAAMQKPADALVEPDHWLNFANENMEIETEFLTLQRNDMIPPQARAAASNAAVALGARPENCRIDFRSGQFSACTPSKPLIKGRGMNNAKSWPKNKKPKNARALGKLALQELLQHVENSQGQPSKGQPGHGRPSQGHRGFRASEISAFAKVEVHGKVGEGQELIQIHSFQSKDNRRVFNAHFHAVLSHGNLILLGTENWCNLDKVSTEPLKTEDDAKAAVSSYIDSSYSKLGRRRLNAPQRPNIRKWDKSELGFMAMAKGRRVGQAAYAQGLNCRLVWEVSLVLENDVGRYKAVIDAITGELQSFTDENHYFGAKGGVFPVTNDGNDPDGVEQAGWPMPFMQVGSEITDSGGNYVERGSQTARFYGPYVNMADNCGTDSLTQPEGIDWGISTGDDCATPGFGGAGNTHASRSGFYHINKVKEWGRSHLPSNSWLQARLTANMNINNTCNAYWNGSTINFYRSGGGCSNTGEIAAVFVHEWGHGMDANDVVGGIASPSGEGIADIYTSLFLNTSCIGRNFLSSPCSGNGDPCLTCSGVRDIDYKKRQSGQPHDYSWSNANCGGSVHCVGGVYSEAVWSLWKRKLQSAPYGYDNNSATEIVTRMTFIAAGNTVTWFSGGPPNGGCAASSGYMNYLAADDDNGNLNDGTPHMTAIYEAFNDQEIACPTPTVQDDGCAGLSTAAPIVQYSNLNQKVALSWNVVSGANSYDIFRTEGVVKTGETGCDNGGKVKVMSTGGTSYTDKNLQNGREYYYVVIPKGSSPACFGPASDCVTAQPISGPDFEISCSPSTQAVEQGISATSTCTVISLNGYSDTINLSCSGNGDIFCSFAPVSISVPSNGSAVSTLTMDVPSDKAVASYFFDVVATSSIDVTRKTGMTVKVIPTGQNGPQDAVYDAGLGAPKCSVVGSSCDTNGIIDGRGTVGPESNYPNTLDDCADGTSGSYHNDESLDRLVVRTLDLYDFSEGATVEVEATVWAWSTGSSNDADFYYAADANNPSWTYIGSLAPSGGGAQVLTTQYTLPNGALQAVRVNFRYNSPEGSCSAGSYNDRDDLVFAVTNVGGCNTDQECDNGKWCDGAETCDVVSGSCQDGTAPNCNDGVSCTHDACNEDADKCDHIDTCDNGIFCDGAETCDLVNNVCQAGTAPNCDDGISCTDDSCSQATDSCEHIPNDNKCPDDDAFCNGVEFCDVDDGCQSTGDPCSSDGVGCTYLSCNEGTDTCENVPNDAACDDGLFCNGVETCDPILGCIAGTDPCSGDGEFCDETNDACIQCAPYGSFCSADEDCCSNKCRGPRGRKRCKRGG